MIHFLTTKQPVLLSGLALYREQKSSADDFELKLPDCTFHTMSDPELESFLEGTILACMDTNQHP